MIGPVSVAKWVIMTIQENEFKQKKVLDEKLSHYPERTWKKVLSLLKEDGEIHSFYDDKFHHMKDEYKK